MTVSPFKPQNMSNNAAACAGGGEIGRAQALQARAAGVLARPDLNPVLIKPQSDRTAQLIVRGEPSGLLEPGDYIGDRSGLLDVVIDSFNGLVATHDLVIVEGAGSPAETNLRNRDIANMGFARRAGVPVCIIGDIDRGGVIASLVGTHAVLDPADAAMVIGFVVNKFRGARRIFEPGVELIERRTGWKCFGVVPWIAAAARLPSEDAVGLPELVGSAARPSGDPGPLRVEVPLLGRIANHDDLDPLLSEPGVECLLIRPGRPIPRDVDLILLPGTKSTIGDLDFCREQGWDHDIIAHARGGGRVFGICGGMQMLGRAVHDPNGVDRAGPQRGRLRAARHRDHHGGQEDRAGGLGALRAVRCVRPRLRDPQRAGQRPRSRPAPAAHHPRPRRRPEPERTGRRGPPARTLGERRIPAGLAGSPRRLRRPRPRLRRHR